MDDGCFWISLPDFLEAFNTLYACRLLTAEDGWLIERREVGGERASCA